jgi:hypothetical protein
MIKDKLYDDGEYIIFNGTYMECYIPYFYFETKLGEQYGSDLRVMGIFNLREFDEKGKAFSLETFNYPSIITIYPSEIEERNLTLLEGDDEPEKYLVAKFNKGARLMRNAIPKDSTNVELFLDLITKGKIPKTVPYSKVIDMWLKNLTINGVKLGVVSSVFEAIISQFYRDKNKPELKFSKTIGKDPKTSEYAYSTANIREICARNSTFAALTFEDMDSMLISSINIKKYDKDEIESPLEKILKM